MFVLVSLISVSAAQPAGAAFNVGGNACSKASGSSVCGDDRAKSKDPVSDTIRKAVNIVAILAGIFAVIFMIVAGINYITSSGDPAKVSKAKDAIIYASVGIIVIVFARALIVFVLNQINK